VVFGALLVLTAATVGASYMHLPTKPAIALCLAIATVKGSLVALWFMHLISERKLIHYVLALTVVFFFALLLIPHWTAEDRPHLQGNPISASGAAQPEPPPQHHE
jgi:cytochrome c oxidase subunit 4